MLLKHRDYKSVKVYYPRKGRCCSHTTKTRKTHFEFLNRFVLIITHVFIEWKAQCYHILSDFGTNSSAWNHQKVLISIICEFRNYLLVSHFHWSTCNLLANYQHSVFVGWSPFVYITIFCLLDMARSSFRYTESARVYVSPVSRKEQLLATEIPCRTGVQYGISPIRSSKLRWAIGNLCARGLALWYFKALRPLSFRISNQFLSFEGSQVVFLDSSSFQNEGHVNTSIYFYKRSWSIWTC